MSASQDPSKTQSACAQADRTTAATSEPDATTPDTAAPPSVQKTKLRDFLSSIAIGGEHGYTKQEVTMLAALKARGLVPELLSTPQPPSTGTASADPTTNSPAADGGNASSHNDSGA